MWVRATVWCLRWNHWGALKHWNQACFRVVNHGIVKQKLTLARIIMMLCKICCSPRFVACFCGDFVKQIEIGQSQKVAKNWMNCMRATEFWREQSMMQSLINGEIPWHIHVTFLHVNIFAHQSECHYFIFFQEISMWKNMNATIEKLKPWLHMTF